MTPEEVGEYAQTLAGCRRKGTATKPAWYVDDRLVARLIDEATLLVRVPLSKRQTLVDQHPDTFGITPRMESHHKVEAYLDRGDPAAIRQAIQLAWEMQRRH